MHDGVQPIGWLHSCRTSGNPPELANYMGFGAKGCQPKREAQQNDEGPAVEQFQPWEGLKTERKVV